MLDAGCGSEAQAEWLLDQGAEVIGADLSPRMIEEARRRCQGRGRFVVADLAGPLPIKPQSLDGITSSCRPSGRAAGPIMAVMVHMVMFHSAFGLRQAEADAAARLRAAGHEVVTPDLYGGQTAGSLPAALALMDTIGWDVICARARQALATVPGPGVLAGFSMGAGVIGSVWEQHPAAAGVVLLHGIAPIPACPRPGLPVQVHLAEEDPFAPRQALAEWQASAARAALATEIFTYPGAGHFYTDPCLADYHTASATLTWQRVTAFLSTL